MQLLLLLLLLLSEQDLRGSDLENMSLSKRFLKDGERAGVSTAPGSQGIQAVTETQRQPQAWLQAKRKQEAPSAWFQFSSVQFSRSVASDSLRPHELQHARPPCPSPTPRVV